MAAQASRSTALFLALLLLPAACSRKAPGPDDCYRFAKQAIGVTDPRMLRSPRVKAAVDQLTNRCLTTPFDRQLLACVNRIGDVQGCFAAFQARHAGPELPGTDDGTRTRPTMPR